MPSWDKESISLFMCTDGQFWKFRGLKGMWDSLQTDKAVLSGESPQYGESSAGREPCMVAHPLWGPFSGSSGPRHSEVQSQSDPVTESLARKRACLTCAPLEGVGAELWLLSGQAGGVQSRLSSSGCSHRACS